MQSVFFSALVGGSTAMSTKYKIQNSEMQSVFLSALVGGSTAMSTHQWEVLLTVWRTGVL